MELARHFMQAIEYSKLKFKDYYGNYKRMPIILLPKWSNLYWVLPESSVTLEGITYYSDRHPVGIVNHTANGFLGHFNLGEIKSISHHSGNFFSIIFNNTEIWRSKKKYENGWIDEHEGINKQKYDALMKRICK